MASSDQEDWLTPKQAATELGLEASSIRRLILAGILPAWKPSPRVTLIKRSDLAKAKARPKTGNPNFQGKTKRRKK